MSKKTAVFGASSNPERYSFIASQMLQDYNHVVVPLGIRKGFCANLPIITEWPSQIHELHTITLYIGSTHQSEHYSYILALKPMRIIFNPGAENPELSALAAINGIEAVEACTLVLLRTNQF